MARKSQPGVAKTNAKPKTTPIAIIGIGLGLPDSPTQMRPKVLAAMEALGEQCGKPPEETLDLLAAKLQSWGECAGRMTDSIFVQRHDDSGGFEEFGIFEEFHPVFYGNGCRTASPLKGVWRKLRPQL